MSKFLKSAVVPAIAMASGFFALNASAVNNTIKFSGSVSAQTCNVSIDGSDKPTILLRQISMSSLQTTPLNTPVGDKTFTISLTGCTPDAKAARTYHMKFVSNNYTTDGDLANEGDAGGVALRLSAPNGQMLNFATNQGTVVGGDLPLPIGETDLSTDFTVSYVKKDDAKLSVGSVISNISYAVDYN